MALQYQPNLQCWRHSDEFHRGADTVPALFASAALQAFDASYDSASEDLALRARGAFLEAFPVNRLRNLAVDSYVIGLQSPTFCDYVEVKTRSWAIIQGATAFNLGFISVRQGLTRLRSTGLRANLELPRKKRLLG